MYDVVNKSVFSYLWQGPRLLGTIVNKSNKSAVEFVYTLHEHVCCMGLY